MFKERMTPDELARLTGYSRQTINKWVRKEGWTTSPKPGVQGGKARLVHVNEQVREYIRNAERRKVREKRLRFLVMRRLKYCW